MNVAVLAGVFALFTSAPMVLADPPGKEDREARKEYMKEDRDRMKDEYERDRDDDSNEMRGRRDDD
jgi:hypothetical protein